MRRMERLGAFVVLGILLSGCGAEERAPRTSEPAPAKETAGDVPAPAEVDLSDMEDQVAEKFREARGAILADPSSGEAWGRFGMIAHVHELLPEAASAYRVAERLDPDDERWPYYLGDVLSILGSDPDAAEAAFRRALERRPEYGPGHWRLGEVLQAAGDPEEAAREFERALELDPDLQPARLALAQARLAEGRLESSEDLLREILSVEPRHSQALNTLAQVVMRRGRRDEAREIAARAKSAAFYSLYSDPLMDPVVSEGASSVLIWERAKAFLDAGDDRQAAIGLRRVVDLQPDNTSAHHQLALAYRNLDRLREAREELETVVAQKPEMVDARVQLAGVLLELDEPATAIPHLRRALEIDPADPDAGWYLGRAFVRVGAPLRAVEAFDAAAERAGRGGLAPPRWAHNEWGSALAQTGRLGEALEHFRAVLEANPEDAQALFYVGLVREGQGKIEEAVEHYCRSMRSEPNPPAASRLQTLGRDCPV